MQSNAVRSIRRHKCKTANSAHAYLFMLILQLPPPLVGCVLLLCALSRCNVLVWNVLWPAHKCLNPVRLRNEYVCSYADRANAFVCSLCSLGRKPQFRVQNK